MENLISEYEKLIYSIMKMFKTYPNKEDLFQVGCIGLINAYNNFKDDKNTKFSTYAYMYILGEMKKLVREDKGIKVSRDISKMYLKIEKASIILSQKMMREPTTLELAAFLNIDEFIVIEALNSTNLLLDIDELNVGDSSTLNDSIYLKEELNKLDHEELNIIKNRYMKDLTQRETADILGISQVQVSRKEQKVLQKLKERLIA